MATKPSPKPTTTRKKATKRGPTKAAALKALGLTNADVQLLKELRTKKAEIDTAQADVQQEVAIELTKPAGEVFNDQSDSQTQTTVTFYARNRQNVPVSFRLSRQEDKSKKRTELKPRGQRGDLVRLEKRDLSDDELITQVEYDLIEIITEPEARDIISKQSINMRERVHPAFAILRNELGEEYEPENIKVAPEYNSQGVTVARLKPSTQQGAEEYGEIEFTKGQRGGFQRVPQSAIGGNPAIISDGFQAQREAMEKDAQARAKGQQAADTYRDGLKVTVTPPQKA